MKLAVVSTYYPAPCGIATYSEKLCRHIKAAENDIEIVVIAERGAQEASGPIPCHPCFHRKEKFSKILLEAILKHKPDIVHFQHAPDILGVDARLINVVEGLRDKGVKTVVTLHTVYTGFTGFIERKPFIKSFHRKIGKSADAIIVHHGLSMKKILADHNVTEDKIHVIPHGTGIISGGDALLGRKLFDLPQSGKIILFFGFIHVQKNIHVLIKAMPDILKKLPDTHLVIAGSVAGNTWYNRLYAKYLDYLIKSRSLCDNVHITAKFIENEQIPHIYAASSLILLPHSQGYGSASGVVHMALGMERPPVCSDSLKFEEVKMNISDELLVPAHNSSAWSQTIVRLLTDDKYYGDILTKVRNYAEKTSWEAAAKKHIEVYKDIIIEAVKQPHS
jgi:glycosyltransferase involved in cell wall biosynthesis